MRCAGCKRDINRGVEAQKQIQVWRTKDGSEEKSFGLGAPDGNLVRNHQTNAYELPPDGREWAIRTGAKIFEVYHSKHWHHRAKREMRGGDVTSGRNLGAATMTAYDVQMFSMNRTQMEEAGLTEEDLAQGTRRLQQRADDIRTMARKAGTATGDWTIKERVRRLDHGGKVYYHQHTLRLQDFKVWSHLLYAHDVWVNPGSHLLTEDVEGAEQEVFEGDVEAQREKHAELHAIMSRDKLEEYKGDSQEPVENDWRDQEVMEVAQVGEVLDLADLADLAELVGEQAVADDVVNQE